MAALAAAYEATSTISVALAPELSTTPRTTSAGPQKEPAGLRNGKGKPRQHTAPEIDPHERGDAEERNRAATAKVDEQRPTTAEISSDGEAARIRSELARDLIHRVDGLLALVGDVSLATNIQLLKRDLAHCHDALREQPNESDFLSIVTLVESALAQLKWKEYTRARLEAIREVFDIGYRQVHVAFSDYEKARTLCSSKEVDATPRIDLESLKWEDITDEEKG